MTKEEFTEMLRLRDEKVKEEIKKKKEEEIAVAKQRQRRKFNTPYEELKPLPIRKWHTKKVRVPKKTNNGKELCT